MSVFGARLRAAQPAPGEPRRWIYAPYDQLSDQLGPLSREDPRRFGLILVESPHKAARRPYHKQKLALLLANQRHFAIEQAARGVAVRYLVSPGHYADALAPLASSLGPIQLMEPAERELRHELAPLVASGALQLLPHEGWLTSPAQFRQAVGEAPPWRMDTFYRYARRATGILMEGKQFTGGKVSFDVENRLPWKGTPPAPVPPRFAPDEITREVGALIEERFARHPGRLDLTQLPTRAEDAQALWSWAKEHCLPLFGPYEDAMSRRSRGLFHTRISALLHLHRLLPRQVVREAEALPLPLASQEGFIRQILGWREFVRHVHRETDGLRRLPEGAAPQLSSPGDANLAAWAGQPWAGAPGEGGAAPSALGAARPLPPAFWGRASGLACLDHVVREVWEDGYSHHITRLMVLSNLSTLLDLSPRQLTDWFWVAYTDAYDWVVEPNVLGMGTYAAGPLMTTKPYVSGAGYLARMGDYCGACDFHPEKTCPITPLYWAFLARHRERLAQNGRLIQPLASLKQRPESRRREDARVFEVVSRQLAAGERLRPADLAPKEG